MLKKHFSYFQIPANFLPPLRFFLLFLLTISAIFLRFHFPILSKNSSLIALIIFCCLTLIFVKKRFWRNLFIFATVFVFSIYRAAVVFPLSEEKISCSGIWKIIDFPRESVPFGQKFELNLIKNHNSSTCKITSSAKIVATDYRSREEIAESSLQLGDSFTASLNLRAGDFSYFATLPKNFIENKITIQPSFLLSWRNFLGQRIDNIFGENSRWVRGLLLGDAAKLSMYDREVLTRTGTNHLLAVSGLHLALFTGFFYFLTLRIWAYSPFIYRIEPRTAAILSAVFAGLFFVFLTGAHTPVVRSWIMFSCILISWLFSRSLTGIFTIFVAAILVLWCYPAALFSIGAWLSFLATAALILSSPYLQNFSPLVQWICIQAALTFMIYPITWAGFGGIAIFSFFVNFIVIPLLGLLILILFLALIFPILADFAIFSLSFYLKPLFVISSWNFYFEPNYQPPNSAAAFFIFAIFFALCRYFRLSLINIFLSCICAILPFLQLGIYTANTKIPSHIFYLKNRQTVLFNTGYHLRQKYDYKRFLEPHFKRRNRRPTAIILTSSSTYAIGGVAELKRRNPNIPIYTLSDLGDFAFEYEYCPSSVKIRDEIKFTRNNGQCFAILELANGRKVEINDKAEYRIIAE
ncbi:MAG: ComEC/Rec2 family competence protein [Cardiobacteriaceae bacterium]|nr:ComEC/Rec2 family competence protein [Cardiobacteriaceae bacterium]